MRCILLIPILLTACDVPALQMRGAERHEVTVGQSRFTVYRLGDEVEVIRTNFEYRKGIMERGYQAIELATGCQVRPGSFDGDPARMTARVTCGPG